MAVAAKRRVARRPGMESYRRRSVKASGRRGSAAARPGRRVGEDEEDVEVDVGEMGEGGALCTQRTDVTLEARECHHWATDFWCGGIDRETKNPDGTLIVLLRDSSQT